MAYRFRPDERFQKGLRRIGLEQVESALKHLKEPGDRSVAIHDARKCLKRVRALLRLTRPGIGETTYRLENARFREIAGLLAGARDLDVMVQTARDLEAESDLRGSRALRDLAASLSAARESAHTYANGAALPLAAKKLEEAKTGLSCLELTPNSFEPIGEGLEACYRACRDEFAQVDEQASAEAIHEWRKTVQRHWRHMLLLSPAWPELMTARAHAARELAGLLGRDHDLAVLLAFIRSTRATITPKDARSLETVCSIRQQAVRREARLLGARLLADRASDLHRRVALYWSSVDRARFSETGKRPPGEAASDHRPT
jgi:CHAD domain-containing protein